MRQWMCSGANIEDDRHWHGSVWGDLRANARRFRKIVKCCKRERGA
jgi:hypothetical protein